MYIYKFLCIIINKGVEFINCVWYTLSIQAAFGKSACLFKCKQYLCAEATGQSAASRTAERRLQKIRATGRRSQ